MLPLPVFGGNQVLVRLKDCGIGTLGRRLYRQGNAM
jgi:hypothetical protein